MFFPARQYFCLQDNVFEYKTMFLPARPYFCLQDHVFACKTLFLSARHSAVMPDNQICCRTTKSKSTTCRAITCHRTSLEPLGPTTKFSKVSGRDSTPATSPFQTLRLNLVSLTAVAKVDLARSGLRHAGMPRGVPFCVIEPRASYL